MESDRPMVHRPTRALSGATHDHRRNVPALQAQLPSASKRAAQRLPRSPTHQTSAGRDRLHLCRVISRRRATTLPSDTRHPTIPTNAAMTKRTHEVMFRIGGEDDLLDRPTVAPATAPQPDSTPIPRSPEPPFAPWHSGRPLDADVLVVPGLSEQPIETLAASATEALDAPALDIPTLTVQRTESTPATAPDTSTPEVPPPTSPLRPQWPRTHQHHYADRQDRSIAPSTRRRHPGLTRLHSWIAWVNALILTVLIVAAIIGHTPPSTTVTSRESSPTRTAARPLDSLSNPRPAISNLPSRPPVREHRGQSSHPAHRRRVTKDVRGDPSVEFAP